MVQNKSHSGNKTQYVILISASFNCHLWLLWIPVRNGSYSALHPYPRVQL